MGQLLSHTPVVQLTDGEMQEVRKLALIRTKSHHEGEIDWESASPGTLSTGDADDGYDQKEDLDVVGVKGEYAFSKFYGLGRPYSEVGLEADVGYDFQIYYEPSGEVLTVDVKCTNNDVANLLMPKHESVSADVYVLTKDVGGGRVIIPGFTYGKILENARVRVEEMKIPTRYMSRYNLFEMFDPNDVKPVAETNE